MRAVGVVVLVCGFVLAAIGYGTGHKPAVAVGMVMFWVPLLGLWAVAAKAAAPSRLRLPGPDDDLTADAGDGGSDTDVIQHAWSTVLLHAPDRRRGVEYATMKTGLPYRDIDRLRRVRNRLAHPAEHGARPSRREIEAAVGTAILVQQAFR